jgi:hypothetical protein
VALVVDGIGVLLMVALGLAIGEPFPGTTTLGLAILAGILSVAGIVGLYRAWRSAGWAWWRRSPGCSRPASRSRSGSWGGSARAES